MCQLKNYKNILVDILNNHYNDRLGLLKYPLNFTKEKCVVLVDIISKVVNSC